MRHFLILALLILVTQTCDAQRLIRKSSKHYIAEQSLPDRVEPLLGDEAWHQYYAPYNDQCPLDSLGNRTVAGCVALAMAQVMHYWQWPTNYWWKYMLQDYEGVDYSYLQGFSVSELLKDCGKSVDTKYGTASSARSVMQPIALTSKFGYTRSMQFLFRDFYSLQEITLMLKRELAAGRPVLVSGHKLGLGHAYVIDGYDENDFFHMRLGNPSNDGDCWTYLPNMTPDQPQWHDKNSPEGGMNVLQSFCIGIAPQGKEDADAVEQHNYAFQYIRSVTDSIHPQSVYDRDSVRLTVHDMSNVGWNTHVDSVVLMLQKDGKNVMPLYKYNRYFMLEEIDDTTYTDTMSISIPPSVGNGAYSIVPMYRDYAAGGGHQWREARTCAGTPNYLIAVVDDDTVTLSSDTVRTAYLTLEDYYFPEVMINGQRNHFELTLKNHNTEMCGRFYLVMESLTPDTKGFYLQMQGVTMMADEVTTRTFKMTEITAPQLGKYKLHIYYESNLFADDLIEFDLPEEIIIEVMSDSSIMIAQHL